jgi:tRNA threonylcarbamoyl adenosine modification protein YeaZ
MTQNYGLALHTTTPRLGLALSNFEGDSRSQTWELGRSLSSKLHTYWQDFLAPQTWTDLAFLAVAKGPGSFTGTRIGMVAARTLAQQLEIPLFAISTLAAIAHAAQRNDEELPESSDIAVQTLASRGQIFTAIYKPTPEGGLTTLVPDTARHIEDWQKLLDRWKQPYYLIDADSSQFADSVAHLLDLAHLDYAAGNRPNWSQALPFYGQHPVDR